MEFQELFISGFVSLSLNRDLWQCCQLLNRSTLVYVFRNCRNHQLMVFLNHCKISLDLHPSIILVTQHSSSFGHPLVTEMMLWNNKLTSLQGQLSLAEVHVSLVPSCSHFIGWNKAFGGRHGTVSAMVDIEKCLMKQTLSTKMSFRFHL